VSVVRGTTGGVDRAATRPSRARLRPGAATVLTALAALAGCTVTTATPPGPTSSQGGPPPPAASLAISPGPSPGGPPTTATPTVGPSTPTLADPVASAVLTDLLTRRSEALRTRDKIAWLSTVADPSSADGLLESQAFDALLALGVDGLTVGPVRAVPSPAAASTTASAAPSTAPSPAAPAVSPPPGTWTGSVRVSYQVPGVDRGQRQASRTVTLLASGDGWRIGRWLGPADAWEVFDIPALAVARSGSAIVAGDLPVDQLARLAGEAELAQRVVARVTRRPAPTALLVAPVTERAAARLLGRSDPAALAQIAATTEGARPAGQPAPADRVVVNPAGMVRLNAQGRAVVLAHELTHVLIRATTAHDVPMWLSEGFAEYVAYRDTGLTPSLVARQLLDRVRTQGPPPALPGPADFDPARGELAAAYQGAWIAVRRIARERGEERLLAFYAEIAGSPGDARMTPQSVVVSRAFAGQVGDSEAQFVVLWRAELTALAQSG